MRSTTLVACGLVVMAAVASAVPGVARADDFIAQCKVGMPGMDNADKICACISDKVAPADRAATLSAMTKTNAALTGTGSTPDMTAAEIQALTSVTTIEGKCMQ